MEKDEEPSSGRKGKERDEPKITRMSNLSNERVVTLLTMVRTGSR